MELTAEELAMLTKDERRQLEEEQGEDDTGDDTGDDTDLDDDAGDDADQDDDDNADDGADDDAGDEDDAGDQGDADKGDQGGDDENGDQDDQSGAADEKVERAPTPLFNAEIPADIEAKRTEINGKEDALVEQFDNGDITFAEYNKQIRALNSERTTLDRIELKAELAREAQQSQIDNQWQGTLDNFLDNHPEIDLTNEIHHTVFDKLLRQHTATIMEKGGVPGLREIKKAHDDFTKALNLNSEKQEPPKETKQTKPAAKTTKQREVPPVLGKVPAAAAADMDDGRFAHLDRLDGDAFEKAFSKLSEADRNAYLAN